MSNKPVFKNTKWPILQKLKKCVFLCNFSCSSFSAIKTQNKPTNLEFLIYLRAPRQINLTKRINLLQVNLNGLIRFLGIFQDQHGQVSPRALLFIIAKFSRDYLEAPVPPGQLLLRKLLSTPRNHSTKRWRHRRYGLNYRTPTTLPTNSEDSNVSVINDAVGRRGGWRITFEKNKKRGWSWADDDDGLKVSARSKTISLVVVGGGLCKDCVQQICMHGLVCCWMGNRVQCAL